jgi:phytoene dehydrogenase-like protein
VDTADAVVVGSGPNGLVAAARLARAGWSVTVLERSAVAGGAVHSAELTVPGYVHDTYSAFYGLLHASPVLVELGLDRAVGWAQFSVPVSAAVGASEVALCHGDARDTASGLAAMCEADGSEWLALTHWWRRIGRRFLAVMLAPVPSLRPTLGFARAAGPRALLDATHMLLQPMQDLAAERFGHPAARALLAAGASHADVPVDQPGSVPAALILAMVAQDLGMPVPVGGAGQLAAALVAVVKAAGGQVLTSAEVTRIVVEGNRVVGVETADGVGIRARRAVLADTGPGALFGGLAGKNGLAGRDGLAGKDGLVGEDMVPPGYLRGLRRFRYGTGVFKVDLALDGPVPWAAPGLAASGVVHLTGDTKAMARAAHQARSGVPPEQPMLIVGQQSVADPSRAPAGCHTLWIETHVPSAPGPGGSWAAERERFLEVVLDRLEVHAPGLRSRIVGVAVRTPTDLERENPNLVGGDLGGGSSGLDQQLIFRPVPGWFRYATPVKGLYLCSASAHPGGGVHGMVGRNCAGRVLTDARLRKI